MREQRRDPSAIQRAEAGAESKPHVEAGAEAVARGHHVGTTPGNFKGWGMAWIERTRVWAGVGGRRAGPAVV